MARTTGRGRVSHRRSDTQADRTRRAAEGNIYMYDSGARALEVRRQLEEEPRKQLSRETRKNRDKALHMNPGYVVFLAGALCICALVLIDYLQMQSDITAKVKNISGMESELNSLQLANEENYNRVLSSVDLEEIRKIAIGELGMTYAGEGQIITYESVGNDYMRRVNR